MAAVKVSFWAALTWLLPLAPQQATAQVRVVAPRNLKEEFQQTGGRIDGSTATFGAPFYGDSFLGRLVYGDSKGELHCTDGDYDVPEPSEYTPEGKSYKEVSLINIVLVERGGCSFVTKVKVARRKHAHAVIIVDKKDSTLTSQDIRNIIVADDGYGSNINIPSVLISRQDGQKLIDAVKRSDSEVVVELSWDIPSQNVVLVVMPFSPRKPRDQWLNTASAASHKFLKEFAPKRAALNEYLQFVPHYHVFSLEGKDYKDLCSDSTGKYCADDPDGGGEITGKQVLHEAVRQLCIHEITVVPTGERIAQKWHMRQAKFSTEWWDYVSKYLDECPATGSDDPLHTFGEKCSERLMHQVGLDVEKVEECIRNTKEDKLAYQRENSAWSSDALRINGWRYSGTMDADLVTKAICAGFVSTPEPCTRLTTPANPFNLDGVVPMPAASGVSNSQVMEVFIVLALVAVGFMYFYKRSMTRNIHTALREEVMLEVQSQMAQYKQLGDL